jgi:hypothetical protein
VFDGVRSVGDLKTSPMMEFYNVLNPLKDHQFVTIKNNFNEVRSRMFTASAINFLEKNKKTDVIALLNKTTDETDKWNLQSSFFVKNEIPTIKTKNDTFKPTWRIFNVQSNDKEVKEVLKIAIGENVDIHQLENDDFAKELQRNLRNHEQTQQSKK